MNRWWLFAQGALGKISLGPAIFLFWNHVKLIFACCVQRVPLSCKLPLASTNRQIPLLQTSCPALRAPCRAGLPAAAVSRSAQLGHTAGSSVPGLPECVHLLSLAVMGKPVRVTRSTLSVRWRCQKQPFWSPAREPEWEVHWLSLGWAGAEGDSCAELRSSPWRSGQACPGDFGWGLIPLSGNPWLLSCGGLSVSVSQIHLSSYY